jgi:Tfp pilus assembly protein PilF
MTARVLSRVETNRSRRTAFALIALLAIVACSRGPGGDGGKTSAAGSAEAQLMDKGLNLLYKANDPIGAEGVFRDVLKQNPSHYGAHFQLAVALDRGSKPVEARKVWQDVLGLAEGYRDSATAGTARVRLAAPDTMSQSAMMATGLDLLYRQGNPGAASAEFRRILERNPKHYGAAYQLATALEKQGQRTQARPIWEKVLGMAVSYKDQATAEIARQHLR